jgi:hypothetical protein
MGNFDALFHGWQRSRVRVIVEVTFGMIAKLSLMM